jgi:hypothetical protein
VKTIRRATRRHFLAEDRTGRPARRGQYRRALPSRGDCPEPLLPLVERLSRDREEATGWVARPPIDMAHALRAATRSLACVRARSTSRSGAGKRDTRVSVEPLDTASPPGAVAMRSTLRLPASGFTRARAHPAVRTPRPCASMLIPGRMIYPPRAQSLDRPSSSFGSQARSRLVPFGAGGLGGGACRHPRSMNAIG